MCNFIKSNGEQCMLARNKERCAKHPIIFEEGIIEKSNIVEAMPPQVNTPVIAEVVDTPAPSVIEPVVASNVKVREVPEMDESIVVPVSADSVVYENNHTSNSKELIILSMTQTNTQKKSQKRKKSSSSSSTSKRAK
ncbi:unnamed protein product [Phytophthora lilii]|uniref:Unnamed protein product n=1 Tax=Phytophthora lilii TaxID=2077276 RepID=A0A9W6T8J6_9STRA|nr:unnamed protein product [Phytophthora lilii]